MNDPTPTRQGHDAPAAPAAPSTQAARAVVAAASGTTINPLDRAGYAQATSKGYGDAMGRGLELALTLVVFGGIGWLIDHLADTSPIFTLLFSVVGFAGIGVKLYLGYDLEMRQHDQGATWSRPSRDGEAPNRAPAPADHSGAASAVADQLAAEERP